MNALERLDKQPRRSQQLERGISCAQRILALADNPEHGINPKAKLLAASEVLRVAVSRANGQPDHVSDETMSVMNVILTDVEVRILYDRLGLQHWSSM